MGSKYNDYNNEHLDISQYWLPERPPRKEKNLYSDKRSRVHNGGPSGYTNNAYVHDYPRPGYFNGRYYQEDTDVRQLGYYTDEESHTAPSTAPSDRTVSEYMIANEQIYAPNEQQATRYVTNERVGSRSAVNAQSSRYASSAKESSRFAGNEENSTGYRNTERGSRYSANEQNTARAPYTEQNSSRYANGHVPGGKYETEKTIPTITVTQYDRDNERDAADIYSSNSLYRNNKVPPSELSHYSYRSYPSGRTGAPSDVSTVKTKTSHKGGITVETMTAPNPFCPNTKGMCCLMILLNLGIILITLGFIVVLQLYEPAFVWYLGIFMLIFGFLTLIGSLLYCVHICREGKRSGNVPPGELYWTHYWHKSINTPEIHYSTHEKFDNKYSPRFPRKENPEK